MVPEPEEKPQDQKHRHRRRKGRQKRHEIPKRGAHFMVVFL